MDFIIFFTPCLRPEQFATWLTTHRGRRSALEDFKTRRERTCGGFVVRTPSRYGAPYIFHRWHASGLDQAEIAVEVECFPLPRRRKLIDCDTKSDNRILLKSDGSIQSSSRIQRFPAENCTINFLPSDIARFGLFIPAILQRYEALFIASKLCATGLKDVHFKDIQHVITAITAPSAQWVTNYQRYEFFGDCILKLMVSSQLFDDYKTWLEGYLSELKSNSRIERAPCKGRVGSRTGRVHQNRTCQDEKVVTCAHIRGASLFFSHTKNSDKSVGRRSRGTYRRGVYRRGLSSARKCVHVFVPDIRIQSPQFDIPHRNQNLCNPIVKVEPLISYQFRNKSLLLEAFAHPSCNRDLQTELNQRLEYLGDAVLDMLLVSILAEHEPKRSQGEMTQIKAALVNGNLLSLLCLELSSTQNVTQIQEEPVGVFRDYGSLWDITVRKSSRHRKLAFRATSSYNRTYGSSWRSEKSFP